MTFHLSGLIGWNTVISVYVIIYLLGWNTDKTNRGSILHISEQLYGHVVVRQQQT